MSLSDLYLLQGCYFLWICQMFILVCTINKKKKTKGSHACKQLATKNFVSRSFIISDLWRILTSPLCLQIEEVSRLKKYFCNL